MNEIILLQHTVAECKNHSKKDALQRIPKELNGKKKNALKTHISVNFPAKPPFLNRVVSGNKERLPWPNEEYVLKENFGSVEKGDDTEQGYQLEDNVKVM